MKIIKSELFKGSLLYLLNSSRHYKGPLVNHMHKRHFLTYKYQIIVMVWISFNTILSNGQMRRYKYCIHSHSMMICDPQKDVDYMERVIYQC